MWPRSLLSRSSKLTHLLKNALGGNSSTSFIANLWDDIEQQQETVSTCRFAQRISKLETRIAVNVVNLDQAAVIEQYAKESQDLRAELAQLQKNVSANASSGERVQPDEMRCKVRTSTAPKCLCGSILWRRASNSLMLL